MDVDISFFLHSETFIDDLINRFRENCADVTYKTDPRYNKRKKKLNEDTG